MLSHCQAILGKADSELDAPVDREDGRSSERCVVWTSILPVFFDQRVDEVLKSIMFVDPVGKFQKKNLAQAWRHVEKRAPSELWLFQPSCAALAHVGR